MQHFFTILVRHGPNAWGWMVILATSIWTYSIGSIVPLLCLIAGSIIFTLVALGFAIWLRDDRS